MIDVGNLSSSNDSHYSTSPIPKYLNTEFPSDYYDESSSIINKQKISASHKTHLVNNTSYRDQEQQQLYLIKTLSGFYSSSLNEFLRNSHERLWEDTVLWKLLIIIQRYNLLAAHLSQVYTRRFTHFIDSNDIQKSCSDSYLGMLSSNCNISILKDANEHERIRCLFLYSSPFRLVLSIVEWCEWLTRITINQQEYRPLPNGSVRCPNTLLRILSDPYNQDDVRRPFHLDVQFLLETVSTTTTSKQKHEDDSHHLTASKKRQLDVLKLHPKDSLDSNALFQSVWILLLQGRLHDLSQLLERQGEQWLESLILGQSPITDPDSAITMTFDSALSQLPPEISSIIDMEHTRTTDLLLSSFEKEHKSNNEEEHFVSSSWPLRIVLEQSADLIRTEGKQGEEFNTGNAWRQLLTTTAKNACQAGSGILSVYERAFYGFLAGDFNSMYPVCQTSWIQTLWAGAIALQEKIVAGFYNILDDYYNQEKQQQNPIFEGCWSVQETQKEIKALFEIIRRNNINQYTRVASIASNILLTFVQPSTSRIYLEKLINIDMKTASSVNFNDFSVLFIGIYKYAIFNQMHLHSIADAEAWELLCDTRLSLALCSPASCKSDIINAIFLLSQISPSRQVHTTVEWLLSWKNILNDMKLTQLLSLAFSRLLLEAKQVFPLLLVGLLQEAWKDTQATLHAITTTSKGHEYLRCQSIPLCILLFTMVQDIFLETNEEDDDNNNNNNSNDDILTLATLAGKNYDGDDDYHGNTHSFNTYREDFDIEQLHDLVFHILTESFKNVRYSESTEEENTTQRQQHQEEFPLKSNCFHGTPAHHESTKNSSSFTFKLDLVTIDFATFLMTLSIPLAALYCQYVAEDACKMIILSMQQPEEEGGVIENNINNFEINTNKSHHYSIHSTPDDDHHHRSFTQNIVQIETQLDQQLLYIIELLDKKLFAPTCDLIDKNLSHEFHQHSIMTRIRQQIHDILLHQSDVLLDNPSILHLTITRQHEEVDLCSFLQFYVIREIANLILVLKDFRVLLVDAVYRVACHQLIDIAALRELADKIMVGVEDGLPWMLPLLIVASFNQAEKQRDFKKDKYTSGRALSTSILHILPKPMMESLVHYINETILKLILFVFEHFASLCNTIMKENRESLRSVIHLILDVLRRIWKSIETHQSFFSYMNDSSSNESTTFISEVTHTMADVIEFFEFFETK